MINWMGEYGMEAMGFILRAIGLGPRLLILCFGSKTLKGKSAQFQLNGRDGIV